MSHYIGSHLISLFGLPSHARVLAVGSTSQHWFAQASGRVHRETLSDTGVADCQNLDLISWDAEAGVRQTDIQTAIAKMRAALKPGGILLVVRRNPFSFGALATLLRKPRVPTARRSYSLAPLLSSVGFSSVEEFLCVPNLTRPEEFPLRGRGFLELPHDFHPVRRLTDRLGCYERFHEASLLVCRTRPACEDPLLKTLSQRLSEGTGQNVRPSVMRFDPRERGALVLFMSTGIHGRPLIVRICDTADERRDVLAGNHGFQALLHSAPSMSGDLQDVVPRPLDHFRVGTREVFVETMKRGTIAWKVNRRSLRSRIRLGALGMISELEKSTERILEVSEALGRRLFPDGSESDDRRHREATAVDIVEMLTGLRRRLRERTVGRKAVVVWAHGDYGYGNVLVDPRGDLTGIIDWSTGRQEEFGGIDRLNLEVQRRRIEERLSLLDALNRTVNRFPSMPAKFIESTGTRELMAICVLRYVTRDLQHPEVARRKVRDLREALRWANELLDGMSPVPCLRPPRSA